MWKPTLTIAKAYKEQEFVNVLRPEEPLATENPN
jgi:hypothetical protein